MPHLLRAIKVVKKAQPERVSIKFPALDLSHCSVVQGRNEGGVRGAIGPG